MEQNGEAATNEYERGDEYGYDLPIFVEPGPDETPDRVSGPELKNGTESESSNEYADEGPAGTDFRRCAQRLIAEASALQASPESDEYDQDGREDYPVNGPDIQGFIDGREGWRSQTRECEAECFERMLSDPGKHRSLPKNG